MGASIVLIIAIKLAGLDGLRHIHGNSDRCMSHRQYTVASRFKCSDICVVLLTSAETAHPVSRETSDFQ